MLRIISDASTRFSENISVGSYLLYKCNEESIVYKNSFYIPSLNNNYCEIYTIYKALEQSLKLGYKNVQVFTDSEFVINKSYHLKGNEPQEIRKISGKIMSISTKFENLNLIRVDRLHVEEAHTLCNLFR